MCKTPGDWQTGSTAASRNWHIFYWTSPSSSWRSESLSKSIAEVNVRSVTEVKEENGSFEKTDDR